MAQTLLKSLKLFLLLAVPTTLVKSLTEIWKLTVTVKVTYLVITTVITVTTRTTVTIVALLSQLSLKSLMLLLSLSSISKVKCSIFS